MIGQVRWIDEMKRLDFWARLYMFKHNISSTDDLTEQDVDAIYAAAGVERARVVEA